MNPKLKGVERLLEKGELEKAESLARALKVDPELVDKYLVNFFIGQAVFRKEMQKEPDNRGRVQEAINFFRESLRENPKFADGYFLNAQAYMARGNKEPLTQRKLTLIKSRFNFEKAKQLDEGLSEMVNSHLSCMPKQSEDRCFTTFWAKDKTLYEALIHEFAGEDVTVHCGDILSGEADAIVSPANSYGFMDGGLDLKLAEFFGWKIEDEIRARIKRKYHGELLVGQAEIVETGEERFPFLICTPTMTIPQDVSNTSNAYHALRAVYLAIEEHNSLNNLRINSVAVPGLCTGIGKMPASKATRQMKRAYNSFSKNQVNEPADIGEAIEFHQRLFDDSLNSFYDQYRGSN